MSSFLRLSLAALCAVLVPTVHAEQKQRLGSLDVHYVVVPSTFFSSAIAEKYDIVRGPDRALINISVLNPDQTPVAVTMEGHMTNLLGQRQSLAFREVREGPAVYYLAPVKHTDQETLRFEVQITAPGDVTRTLTFQQKMYRADR